MSRDGWMTTPISIEDFQTPAFRLRVQQALQRNGLFIPVAEQQKYINLTVQRNTIALLHASDRQQQADLVIARVVSYVQGFTIVQNHRNNRLPPGSEPAPRYFIPRPTVTVDREFEQRKGFQRPNYYFI